MGTLPARRPLAVSPVGHRTGHWTVADDGLASRSARSRGTGTYETTLPAALGASEFALPGELAADVADAETVLAAFDAHAAARLGADNPALGPMSAVLLRTESASSSQIEDLTVGARQLALAELDESRSGNARAVVANVRTMEAALRLAADLDLEAILAMHAELLAGAEDAGQLRRQLVWVGRSGLSPLGAVHIAPEAEDVLPAMDDLLTFLARDDLPVLVHAALAHAQFETIHPFADGNGRTGRALVHALLSGKGLLTTTAPVSAGLLTDLEAYTAALTAFRAGDARPIVEEFARAARYAATTGSRLVDDLAEQLERDRERLSGVRRHALAWSVLPLLIGQPIVNAAHLQRTLEVPAMTAQRALAQLTESGILQEATGRSRNRVWQHTGILGLLDAYAAEVRRAG
ncbi:cell filamentation protein Fic [Brachybacterium vulturis]|uniref:Cell filamentation protein Fic n=1 Tax=Brachybacterium vulturis TaxID=2017484 RepID=A0A291GMR4_9MICO|nr:Fic family protein [Brachybacterium vulturis]ATG51833.1 cell filamentation protein Fic [Brachybacterium vulturis]